MQRLVVNGSLPCSKEEAAALAGIQLRLEECWPRSRPPRTGVLGLNASSAPHTPNVNSERSAATTGTTTTTSKLEEERVSGFYSDNNL